MAVMPLPCNGYFCGMAYRFLPSSILGQPFTGDAVHIVGAGIAGLMAGLTLHRRDVEVQLYEQESKTGGLIETHQTPHGFLEGAANGFIWCPEMQQLADWSGVEILPPGTASKARYIVRNGKLKRFPLYNWEVLGLLGKALVPHKGPFDTVADFGEAYLGKTATYQVLEPALGGIYGADIRHLSFPGALPMLAKSLNQSSWLPAGYWQYKGKQPKQPQAKAKGTHSFLGGMQTFVRGMTDQLAGKIHVETDGLKAVPSDAEVLLTLPAYAAAEYFEDHPIANLLRQTPYTPITSVKMIFKQEDVPGYQAGFGCLIPRSEGKTILGILFNHDIFPENTEEGYYSFTAIMRDEVFDPEWPNIESSDEELIDLVTREVHDLIPISGQPVHTHIDRYRKGIPLYTPDHYNNLFTIHDMLQQDFPNVRLFGNYTGEISVRGMGKTVINDLGQ